MNDALRLPTTMIPIMSKGSGQQNLRISLKAVTHYAVKPTGLLMLAGIRGD